MGEREGGGRERGRERERDGRERGGREREGGGERERVILVMYFCITAYNSYGSPMRNFVHTVPKS